MAVVVRLLGLACGDPSPVDGQWLVEYDPDRPGVSATGEPTYCHVQTAPRICDAKRFADAQEMYEYVTRVKQSQPFVNNRPNRPLLAYTLETVKLGD